MKKYVTLAALLILFCGIGAAQSKVITDSVYVYTDKTDKLKSCLFVVIDKGIVEFRITDNSVKTFIEAAPNIWATFNKKIVTREIKEGWVIFHDNGKAYLYKVK